MFKLGMDPERHIEDGKEIGWWVRVYFDYTTFINGSPLRFSLPQGLPPDAQPALLIAMFDEIESGIMNELRIDAQQRH